jgi:hypothetical protein
VVAEAVVAAAVVVVLLLVGLAMVWVLEATLP